MRRALVPVAFGMAALYMALAILAASCLFTHVGQADTAHHQQQTPHGPHSAFCAWLCQANPAVSDLIEAPHPAIFQAIALLILLPTFRPAYLIMRVIQPRAPPSF